MDTKPTLPEPSGIDPMLLARFLSGETSADESARVERWIQASPDNRQLVDTMRAAWARPPAAEFDPDDAVWQRIAQGIDAPRARPTLVREPEPRRVRSFQLAPARSRWVAVAAAAIIAVASAVTANHFLTQPDTIATDASPMREIATGPGERTVLDLPDGSRVIVAAESRLRIPETYRVGSGPRDVHLDGEAFFEVDHNERRPFRVHTASGIAEDLGTEYVVTTYPEVGGMRVVVAEGAVALRRVTDDSVSADGEPGTPGRALLTLAPGDLATLDSTGAATVRRRVNVGPYFAWTRGALAFDGTPLREVIPALRRWYDADVRLADPALADLKLTAAFEHESVEQVLRLIAMSLDLTVERHEDTFILHPHNGAERS